MAVEKDNSKCVHGTLEFVLLVAIGSAFLPSVNGKTVQGVFTSNDAQEKMGHYITSFCFHSGNGTVHYRLNSTASAGSSIALHLFVDEDWLEANEVDSCHKKLELARLHYNLTEGNSTEGSVSVYPFTRPRLWHLVLADSSTCDQQTQASTVPDPNYMHYQLELLNPDALHNPTDHCSCEELGLLRFFQLLTLTYFVGGCIFSPRVWEALQKQGPMHILLQLLNCAMAMQAVATLIVTLSLRQYSVDGLGSPWLDFISQVFEVGSQYVMLLLLLSLSMGRELAGVSLQLSHHLQKLKEKPTTKVVLILASIQGVMVLVDQFHQPDLVPPLAPSVSSVILLGARVVLAVAVAMRLQSFVGGERSVLKRHFYSSFTKNCLLWFLCYPALVLTSFLFSSYFKYKFVCMGVRVCQCLCGMLLYRLLLSRSLYWEVSSLSSYLPLRMDKTFGTKLYS